jgi:hypothetical protein
MITTPIQVVLKEATYKRLTENLQHGSPYDVLSARASVFFEHMAEGGLMLKPEQVQKIEENAKRQIQNGEDVVAAAEQAVGRKDGGLSVSVRIDPVWETPLRDLAEQTDRTIEALLTDLFTIAMENNWVYATMPSTPPIYIQDSKLLKEFTGEERPTSVEIEHSMREWMKRRRDQTLIALAKAEKAEPEPVAAEPF